MELIGYLLFIIGIIISIAYWPPITIAYLIAIGYYLANKPPTKFYW